MEIDIQDGRLQYYSPEPIETNNQSSVLTQALETNDTGLLDWCIENTSPPKELSLSHLAHLITFLSSRYWVYSNPKALAWISFLMSHNFNKLHKLEEFRPVLEDLKAKLQAKTQGFDRLTSLKNTLQFVSSQKTTQEFSVIKEPRITINEE
jgi:hypothetical protein